MTRSEFITKLQKYFKPENDEVITRLNEWLLDNRFSDKKLDDFFVVVTELHEHKYFPNLPQLNGYLKHYYAGRPTISIEIKDKVDHFVGLVNNWHSKIINELDIKQIITWLQKAHKHKEDALATSIISKWDAIYWAWRECVTAKMREADKVRRLNYIKDCIIENKKIDPPSENIDIAYVDKAADRSIINVSEF